MRSRDTSDNLTSGQSSGRRTRRSAVAQDYLRHSDLSLAMLRQRYDHNSLPMRKKCFAATELPLGASACSWNTGRKTTPLAYPDQVDIEDQHPVGRLPALIRKPLRDPKASFLALHHELQSFGPPGNNAIHR